MRRPRLHAPTIVGRLRSDPGLLLLIGLVVVLTTVLTAAVGPLTERTADRAIAASVRDAGPRGAVVATFPEGYDDPRGDATRDPTAAEQLRQDATYARSVLPAALAGVLRPGVASVTTPALQLLDAGPGRYLRLAYADTPDGPPAVTWTAGHAPRASSGSDRPGGSWPVQVALSEPAARALGLGPGDRLDAEDEQHRPVRVRISGVYVADDPADEAWQVSADLLEPTRVVSDGLLRTTAGALVSPESLPDLQLAVPADDLAQRVVFLPRPTDLRWRSAGTLQQQVVALQTSAGLARGEITWSSLLDRVLDDGRAEVAAARGQAQVLLLGLLACALLVLVQAAQLLVHRRAGPVSVARERGASLVDIAAELLVEALAVAVVGVAVGLAATRLLVGGAAWTWSIPVLVVAAGAAPVLGVVLAGRATGARRVPANRSARRTAARGRQLLRLALEVAVVAAATLSYVALRQRGVVSDGGDPTAAGAAAWWAVVGTLLLLRLVPPAGRLALRAARRTSGGTRFLLAARLTQTGAPALPLLVVTVAVAQLTLGVSLAATEQQGQAAGALLAVGADARLDAAPGPAVDDVAREVAAAPGVRAAVAGRVEDGVPASARRTADTVRLVVVDAAAYERLLAASALPDAPRLARLGADDGDRVPALLLGGDPDLAEGLLVRWEDGDVPLQVVGEAPRVGGSGDPVVVVDARAFADAGAAAPPDTVWAVGPEAASVLAASAGTTGTVVRYADDLDDRRAAPLAAGLVRLAVAAAALLLLLALLGVVLGAAAGAPARAESLGRLRSLGIPDGALRRILAGELAVPVVVAAVAGLALGVGSAHATLGSLALERITGQTDPPSVVVPWWIPLTAVALLVAALVVAAVEWRRLRRRVLAELLRS